MEIESVNFLPQNTTIGSKFFNKTSAGVLEKYMIENNYPKGSYEVVKTDIIEPYFIVGKPEEEQLPVLDIPYYIDILNKRKYLFTDIRMFIKPDDYMATMTDHIKQPAGFMLTRDISIWIMTFLSNKTPDTGFQDYAMMMYVYWIIRSLSLGIVKLTPEEISNVMFVCGLFYKRIGRDSDFTSTDLGMLSFKLAKTFRIQEKQVNEILNNDRVDPDHATIVGLLENIRMVIEEGKRRYFNTVTLLDILTKTWFGYNRHIYLPLAVECKPVWISILYHTLTNNTYKNTILKSIIDRQAVNKQKFFIRAYEENIENRLMK